ncbi:MAG: hypothetical protein OEU36_16760, partial [Gammaproteobacteria bacterium]|nr:hypothetical protein [Gammaproteobacteria bacterium]
MTAIFLRLRIKEIVQVRTFGRLFSYLAAMFIAPLVGVWISGKSSVPYLEFPPIPSEHIPANFSWFAFVLMAILIVLVLVPFVVKVLRTSNGLTIPSPRHHFPAWGWYGVIWLLAAWVLAWTRFDWFATLQEFTFTPLWLGYILVVNALTYQRTGRCMLTHRWRYFLMLFPLSAVLWWSFEYLNRFAGNWHYVGTNDFTPWRYFVFATLPFSTVLPAVLGTAEWLKTFPRV